MGVSAIPLAICAIGSLRGGDNFCGFGGAPPQLFERAAERLTVALRLRLPADDQGEAVYGFREVLAKVDEDYQGIGVQLPDGGGIPRALEFLHLGGDARGYSDDTKQHSGSVRLRACAFEMVGGVGLNLGWT